MSKRYPDPGIEITDRTPIAEFRKEYFRAFIRWQMMGDAIPLSTNASVSNIR